MLNATPFGDFTKWWKPVHIAPVDPQELKKLRIRRLDELIRGKYDNNVSEFARAAKRQQSYFADVLGGRKSFGEKVVRQLERDLKLDPLYFDRDAAHSAVERPHATIDPWPFAIKYSRYERLNVKERKRIEGVVEKMISDIEAEQVAASRASKRRAG